MQSDESSKVIEQAMERARRGGLLLIDYKAWHAPIDFGRESRAAELSSRSSMHERLGKATTRAVWDDPLRPGARLAVTATEHDSASDALRGLATELEANQLATLPRGPSDVGEVSFVHPEGVPPALFFARGNLTISVFSFGNQPIDVLAYARTIDGDLTARPANAREGVMELSVNGTLIEMRDDRRSVDSYIKVVAPGAELAKRDQAFMLVGDTNAEIGVFVIEPGRETYGTMLRR
jgi:hypothetical protein